MKQFDQVFLRNICFHSFLLLFGYGPIGLVLSGAYLVKKG